MCIRDSLSPGKVHVGIQVVLIVTEVWHIVVHGVRLGWLLDNPLVVQLLLRLGKIVLSETDVVISTEVGDEVIDVVASLEWLEGSLHGVLKFLLSLSQVVLSLLNVSISAKVGHIVVDVPVWLLP